MQLKCENPVIIYNPYLRYLVCKYLVVRLGFTTECFRNMHHQLWNDFPWSVFNRVRPEVTLDNIDNYYVIDLSSGETFPVFMAVPCGHCTLCKERKAKMWQTRCLAETAMSDYPPLFITLTYRPDALPAEGVNKPDVQKFMKRLRKRLADDGFTASLRYVLVSEYGKTTHRAHYHMLLWNMPYINDTGKNSWQALHDYIQDAWSHGWIGLERCIDCSGKYCMKYLRKECYVPAGQNPTFLLASRRGGIGRKFADSLIDFARSHPDLNSVTIFNKFDGSTTRCAIPDYFKRLWFPSLSGIVKQEIRDDVSAFMEHARTLGFALSRVPNDWVSSSLLSMVDAIHEKYDFCIEDFNTLLPSKHLQADVIHRCTEYARFDPLCSYTNRFYDEEWSTTLQAQIKTLYDRLLSYDINRPLIDTLLALHSEHTAQMLRMAELMPEVNIADEVARVERENVRVERGHRPDD